MLSPEGLAAVVLLRDTTIPYPEGCAVPGREPDDPYTHRPFFNALQNVSCARTVLPMPGTPPFAVDVAAAVEAFRGAMQDEACALAAVRWP